MQDKKPIKRNTTPIVSTLISKAEDKSHEAVRLNKYIASTGLCSRRDADLLIDEGKIMVNDIVVTDLGTKIQPTDVIKHNGKLLKPQKFVYVLLNKPKDVVTTMHDPHAKLTVMDLVKNACKERIYPVGRLDKQTTGVLLLTNDGELADKLTHPSNNKLKVYHAVLDKTLSKDHFESILKGIELEDGPIQADALSYIDPTDERQIGIEIHSGRNRIIRRIFEHLGYQVNKLDRVYFAGLTKKGLQRGHWRHLTTTEVASLKMGSYK